MKYRRQDRMTLTFDSLHFDATSLDVTMYVHNPAYLLLYQYSFHIHEFYGRITHYYTCTRYLTINKALVQYTKNVLSTKAVASYVLETMATYSRNGTNQGIKQRISTMFDLTHQDHDMDKGDYMTDFLLHGFKKLLGEEIVVDFPRVSLHQLHFFFINF